MENFGQQELKGEPSRTERIPQVFRQKAKVFGILLVKQKNPNGNMTAALEGGCKQYGSRIHLVGQPEKSRSGKRKTK